MSSSFLPLFNDSQIIIHCVTDCPLDFLMKNNNTKCWQWCGATRTRRHCWWKWKTPQPFWKTVGQFLIKLKLNIYLPWPNNSSPKYLLKWMKTHICTDQGLLGSRGGRREWLKKHRRIFWGGKILLHLDYIDGCTMVGIFQTLSQHKKRMTFTIDVTKKKCIV